MKGYNYRKIETLILCTSKIRILPFHVETQHQHQGRNPWHRLAHTYGEGDTQRERLDACMSEGCSA